PRADPDLPAGLAGGKSADPGRLRAGSRLLGADRLQADGTLRRAGQLVQHGELGAARVLAAGRGTAHIAAVGLQKPGLGAVVEMDQQLLFGAAHQRPALPRDTRRAPLVEVALHHVGAGQPDLLLTLAEEVVDPTVLEETADHRAYRDVVRHPGDAGAQTAHPANDEIHPHARL